MKQKHKKTPHDVNNAAGFPGQHFVASLSAAFSSTRRLTHFHPITQSISAVCIMFHSYENRRGGLDFSLFLLAGIRCLCRSFKRTQAKKQTAAVRRDGGCGAGAIQMFFIFLLQSET